MAILITGGAGYIGSHTCLQMLAAGYEIVVVDNLSNSCEESLHQVRKISSKQLTFIYTDICNKRAMHVCRKWL